MNHMTLAQGMFVLFFATPFGTLFVGTLVLPVTWLVLAGLDDPQD